MRVGIRDDYFRGEATGFCLPSRNAPHAPKGSSPTPIGQMRVYLFHFEFGVRLSDFFDDDNSEEEFKPPGVNQHNRGQVANKLEIMTALTLFASTTPRRRAAPPPLLLRKVMISDVRCRNF